MGAVYCCSLTDGTGSAGPHLTAWFQAWASSQGIVLVPGTLNLCADRDVVPPAAFLPITAWDAALLLAGRKAQVGYDPRLYEIRLGGSTRAWLFRWADLPALHIFVGDTPGCPYRRRCEIIGEVHFTTTWQLTPHSLVTLELL